MTLGPAPLPRLAPLAPDVPSRGGSSAVMPEIVWRDSISLGLPYHGRLIDGVQLPAQSPLWVTWDPALDRVPDRGYRRYGSAKLDPPAARGRRRPTTRPTRTPRAS